MNKLAAAFLQAKKDFAPVIKNSTNPHFRSKYADLATCIAAVDESFLKHGIVMYQENSLDEKGVTIETILLHESGESIRCGKLHIPASKMDAQGFGSAQSYARRYSLMAACGIAPEDDDGNAAAKKIKHKPIDGDIDADENLAKRAAMDIIALHAKDDIVGAFEVYEQVTEKNNEMKLALWSLLPSNVRTAITKHGNALKAFV